MEKDQEEKWEDVSKKLNILISLSVRNLLQDNNFVGKRKKGTGDLANYLASFGINSKDIAEILGAPVQSIRTFLTPRRRKK